MWIRELIGLRCNQCWAHRLMNDIFWHKTGIECLSTSIWHVEVIFTEVREIQMSMLQEGKWERRSFERSVDENSFLTLSNGISCKHSNCNEFLVVELCQCLVFKLVRVSPDLNWWTLSTRYKSSLLLDNEYKPTSYHEINYTFACLILLFLQKQTWYGTHHGSPVAFSVASHISAFFRECVDARARARLIRRRYRREMSLLKIRATPSFFFWYSNGGCCWAASCRDYESLTRSDGSWASETWMYSVRSFQEERVNQDQLLSRPLLILIGGDELCKDEVWNPRHSLVLHANHGWPLSF